MKVLVCGASGLIGSAVCARLAHGGHQVVAAGRGARKVLPPGVAQWISLDLGVASEQDWIGYLAGVDAVVNCVGVLQDSPSENVRATHVDGPAALYAACLPSGVRKVIHFSAIGIDRHQASPFSATKLVGDKALMALPLDWVILRPSVVLGSAAFGASALFRGLAALPVLPSMPATGELQVVDLQDVTATVALLLEPTSPTRIVIELAGPERLSMLSVVAAYRRWLGWSPARVVEVPKWASSLLYRLGDFAASLGWRPPIRSTAMREIGYGAVGDAGHWHRVTCITPRSLSSALAQRPAGVQERWFARLYFIKPVLFAVLVSFWLLTGIISISTGFPIGVDLMVKARTGIFAAPGVIAGAIVDILVGLAIAYRPTAFYGLWAAIVLSCFYIVAGTALLPELWNEPLGPLLKIWPILVAHAVALAILEER
jgi:uncharacterized protein YbjT (DUF2867 family)